MRGRALGFVAILCATWVTVRVGFIRIVDGDKQVAPHHNVPADAMANPITDNRHGRPTSHAIAQARSIAISKKDLISSPVLTRVEPMAFSPNRRSYAIRSNAGDLVAKDKTLDPISSEAITFSLVEPAEKKRSKRIIKIYGYSFWRQGDAAQEVLSSGQYGGGQSALLMTIPMLKLSKDVGASSFALIGRASVAHDDLHAREWSAGLRWYPSAVFPAQLSLERRFRPNHPDAVAAFISGGHDGTSLPLGFVLNGYGQAGFVTGKAGGGFADGQLHILKSIASYGTAKLAAGAGAWAGGQSDIMRVDIGPSVRANLQAGATSLRLDASWRFRIMGNARPDNGPAVTLSTSF